MASSLVRFYAFSLGLLFTEASPTQAEPYRSERNASLTSRRPYIPPACYAKTRTENGRTRNPCYVCHTKGQAPNFTNDEALQLNYDFDAPTRETVSNPWTNLLGAPPKPPLAFSSAELSAYVRTDNYQGATHQLLLTQRLRSPLPPGWDHNGNGVWDGYLPDSYFNFDERGFDHAPSGALTGWRTFAYTPFPGGFWPTNGSFGDAQIRLPNAFRTDPSGKEDVDLYALNLAVVEALLRRSNVPIAETDERRYGTDLDLDGKLGLASKVVYLWPAQGSRHMSYVGAAALSQPHLTLAAGLYPVGTEFLHAVRYLDADGDGPVKAAPHLKELRYSRKTSSLSYALLEAKALADEREDPARPRTVLGDTEVGLSNGLGWIYQGFIEDRSGELRPQTFEETAFCLGCHSGLGASTDSSFAFPRKLSADAFQGGYYSTAERGFDGIPEPKRADGRYEYSLYLEHTRSGDGFGMNSDIARRFFDHTGNLKHARIRELHHNLGALLLPSPERARRLNALYRAIVSDQSFAAGRELGARSAWVHASVLAGTPTGTATPVAPFWARGGTLGTSNKAKP